MRRVSSTRVIRMQTHRIGLTRDFLRKDGSPAFGDIGLELLDAADEIDWEYLPKDEEILGPEHIRGYDGLILLGRRLTAETLAGNPDLRIVARFGVGYDKVDVAACTRAGVVLTITPDAVRRPVAVAAMAFILVIAHRVIANDRLTRDGRWLDRVNHLGLGLVGRVVGIVGLGNIGSEVATLARAFDLRVLAFDPFIDPNSRPADVELVGLDRLLSESDFVCLTCPLTDETRHLIDASRLARMKSTAHLINVARGPIVDEEALVQALSDRTIAGAALDVFETEPLPSGSPLLSLENVVLAPHAAAWTDELFRANGRSACRSVLTYLGGAIPHQIVNRDVLEHPRVQQALAGAASGIGRTR
jgi:phosphoglycerate dehydrogenase-like enzyme